MLGIAQFTLLVVHVGMYMKYEEKTTCTVTADFLYLFLRG